jgi:hypothetical protein
MGSEAFLWVVGCWGGWLAERDCLECRGRRFIKEASVQVRIGMPESVFADVVQKSTNKGLLGMIMYEKGTTHGVQNDIQEGIQGTGG